MGREATLGTDGAPSETPGELGTDDRSELTSPVTSTATPGTIVFFNWHHKISTRRGLQKFPPDLKIRLILLRQADFVAAGGFCCGRLILLRQADFVAAG